MLVSLRVRTHTPPIERPAVRPGPDSPAAQRPSDGVERRRRGFTLSGYSRGRLPTAIAMRLARSFPTPIDTIGSERRPYTRSAHWYGWLGRPSSSLGGADRTAAKPSWHVQPRGDRYGATSPKGEGRHLQAAGRLKPGFDSPRGLGPKVGAFRPAGGTQTRVTARVIP